MSKIIILILVLLAVHVMAYHYIEYNETTNIEEYDSSYIYVSDFLTSDINWALQSIEPNNCNCTLIPGFVSYLDLVKRSQLE